MAQNLLLIYEEEARWADLAQESADKIMKEHDGFKAASGQYLRGWNPLLPTAKAQESIHNLAVQMPDINLFLLQPTAEIGDHDNLLSDRVVTIALCGHNGRTGVEVFAQRPLAQSFNRA